MCARSAYDVLSANLRLCIEYCKKLSRPGAVAALEGGKAIAITLPDVEELRRTVEYMGDAEPWPNVRLNSLGGDTAPDRNPLEGLWSNVFKQSGGGDAVVAEWAGMYVLLGASCQELPTIKKLHELQPDKPIVCFNLKLDVLRGDLGLPAFPPKTVHHEFLCRVKPVYYLRPRSYSLSLSVPPFLIAYQGVLYRRYPEGWQTLLDRGKSSFRRIELADVRPNLGTFKSQLTAALKLADEKAAASAISSAGFKQSTWWEGARSRSRPAARGPMAATRACRPARPVSAIMHVLVRSRWQTIMIGATSRTTGGCDGARARDAGGERGAALPHAALPRSRR